MAELRSKTAAHCLFGLNTDYAGTDSDSVQSITLSQVMWADIIVCMEDEHRSDIRHKYKYCKNNIQVWGIPDDYPYMDTGLVSTLRSKAERRLCVSGSMYG
jgi:predicted protein tyrosine phosphatase